MSGCRNLHLDGLSGLQLISPLLPEWSVQNANQITPLPTLPLSGNSLPWDTDSPLQGLEIPISRYPAFQPYEITSRQPRGAGLHLHAFAHSVPSMWIFFLQAFFLSEVLDFGD